MPDVTGKLCTRCHQAREAALAGGFRIQGEARARSSTEASRCRDSRNLTKVVPFGAYGLLTEEKEQKKGTTGLGRGMLQRRKNKGIVNKGSWGKKKPE